VTRGRTALSREQQEKNEVLVKAVRGRRGLALVALGLLVGGCGGSSKGRYGGVVSATVSTSELSSQGGSVTIEAQVSATNTSTVYALLTLAGAAPLRVDLANTTGSHYAGTVHLPANPGGGDQVYRVEIYARNLLNELLGPVSAGTITVRGSGAVTDLPPAVTAADLSPASLPAAGGNVEVTVQVEDRDRTPVQQVYLLITGASGTTRLDLVRTAGDAQKGTYQGTFSAPPNATPTAAFYVVSAYAEDTGNLKTGPIFVGSVQVAGVAVAMDRPPTVSQPQVTPVTLPDSGGTVTVSVEVEDRDETPVRTVTLEVIRPDATVEQVPLARTAGTAQAGTYQGQFVVPDNPATGAALYVVVAYAEDTADQQTGPIFVGNVSVAGKGVPVDQPPTVSQAQVTPTELTFEGGPIALEATVTDPDASGVESVFAEITQPDRTIRRVSLARIAGDAAHGTYRGTLDLPGNAGTVAQTYEVVIGARDTAQLSATPVTAGRVTVAALQPPPEPPSD